jgi:hypothetical protein
MAAAQSAVTPHKVFFFSRGGSLLWSYEIENPSLVVSISGDGATLAVGTGAADTGYLLSTGYSSAPRPVGGIMVPTNKLEILTPYLVLAALIAVVSAIVVVRKRSRD